MENQNTSIKEVTEHLLRSFGLGKGEQMKSLKEMGEEVSNQFNENPLPTVGAAFTLGFISMKLIRSPKEELRKKISSAASAAGAALLFGLVNQVVKPEPHEMH